MGMSSGVSSHAYPKTSWSATRALAVEDIVVAGVCAHLEGALHP